MEAIARLFARICLFKKGPQDVPASMSFLIVLFIINFVIEFFLGLTVYNLQQSIILASVSVLALLFLTWLLLYLFQLKERFLQTATAFIGVSLFANVICFVPITIIGQMEFIPESQIAIINLFLLMWLLSIYAHIFKNALSVSFFLGLAIAITYFIITYSTFSTIIGIGAQS